MFSFRKRNQDTYSDVVNPDHVAVVERDGISTPDVFGVYVGNSDVSVAVSIVSLSLSLFSLETSVLHTE